MKRLRKIASVCVLTFALSTPVVFAQSAETTPPLFSDVPATHENYVAIKFLKEQKVIGGYADGTFKPGNVVNRAEALKFILAGTGIDVPELTATPSFSDVKQGDWHAKYIMQAKSLSIVNGNPDGTFKPGTAVNRAGLIKMLLMANKFKPDSWKPSRQFSDVKESDWYYKYMSYAGAAGLIREDTKGNLFPAKDLTRGEVAEILYLMTIIRNGSNQKLLISQTEQQILAIDVYVNSGNLLLAKRASELAVDFTQQALKISPSDITVLGLAKIAKAYDFVLTAFIAGVQKNYELAKNYAIQAAAKANEAVDVDPKTKPIADYIQTRSQEIINQIPK